MSAVANRKESPKKEIEMHSRWKKRNSEGDSPVGNLKGKRKNEQRRPV